MYALIEFAGKQYRVEEGSSIKVPRVQGKVGTKVTIDTILYLAEGDKKILGSPFVAEKKLNCEIVSHGRGRKVVVFKFKRRKGYQTKNTHRDKFTILKFGKLGTAIKQVKVKKSVDSASKKAAEKKDKAIKKAPKKAVNNSGARKTSANKTSTKKAPAAKSINNNKEKE